MITNMSVYSLALKIIDECIINDASFASLTKQIKKEALFNKEDIKQAMTLSASSLRRYLAIEYAFKDLLTQFSDHLKNSLIILIANELFFRIDSFENVCVEANKVFEELNSKFPKDELKTALNKINDKSKLIPETIEENSPLYLSLRYNCPLWVVKMWIKHYDFDATKLILRSLTKTNEYFGIINKNLVSYDWCLEQENIIESGYYGVVKTKDETPIKNHPLAKEHKIYPFSPALNDVLTMMDIDQLRGIAFYAGTPTNIYFKLYSSFGKDIKFDYIAADEAYYVGKEDFEHLKMRNIFIYKGEPSSLIACISKPVHVMFCLPACSNYSALRYDPEAFKHMKQEDLDNFILKEKETLEECSKYVEDGGELLYLIPTISKKEGPSVVYDFINAHKEFSLIKSQQCFPFKKHNSCFYYALFKKKEKEND